MSYKLGVESFTQTRHMSGTKRICEWNGLVHATEREKEN